jgi:hypothetical protein
MSVTGILSSNLLSYSTQSVQDRMQQFRKDFQQLGQDLQTGNLSGAKADFAALQNDSPQATSSSSTSNSIAQTIQQLSADLQSGNLTGAQQDYTTCDARFWRSCCRGRTCSRATWPRRRRPTARCSSRRSRTGRSMGRLRRR